MHRLCVIIALSLGVACGGITPVPESADDEGGQVRTLFIVGTNDLHGHLEAMPVFAGYMENLRRRADFLGAGVALLDGGDMFQGTLESNLLEGAPVVAAYDALGYDAVTIGNHEFDYGPAGELPSPASPGDDPRGALLERIAEASYPFLSANLLVRETGARIDWPGVLPTTRFRRADLEVGVIGVTTEATLTTTLAANVADLQMASLLESVRLHATALRRDGAEIVLVAAHAGGRCASFDEPSDLGSCEDEHEIFDLARALPGGLVDAIVAGHTHAGVAHVVNGIPIIESYAYGRAFGRVNLTVVDGEVRSAVEPPRALCVTGSTADGDCDPGIYAGRVVVPSSSMATLIEPATNHASALRARPLGVSVTAPITRSRTAECALGNLFTDLMLAARSEGDVALTNGGGLRADLSTGPLTYGELYEAMPFDNRFALVRMTVGELRALLADNLQRSGSFFSIAGARAEARCEGGELTLELRGDEDGEPVWGDDRELTLVTTDFLATGGDGFAALREREGAVTVESGEPVRDAMAAALGAQGGELRPQDLFDPAAPRVSFAGERPIRCP